MNLVDVDLVSEPPVTEGCNLIASNNYPFCLLGFQIKNSYDQQRLQLKDKYKTNTYVHRLPNSEGELSFFRGIKITPKADISNLLRQLENFNTSLNEIPLKHYESVLSNYKLSCKNCYSFLKKGVYPIDGECVNTFAKEVINLDSLYDDGFDTDQIPPFQSYAYFTIFILENKSIFKR
jgi:hypothetical protein